MPSNLPKTYKVGVFNEANKPLTFEERELKLPEDGQVSPAIIERHSTVLTFPPGPRQSPSMRRLPLGLSSPHGRLRQQLPNHSRPRNHR